MNAKIAAAMDDYMDRQFMKAIYGGDGATTTAFAAPEQEPLTLEKLNAMIDSLPKREEWVVWSLPTSRGKGLVADTPDLKVTIIHPDDWYTVEHAWRSALPADKQFNSLYGINATWIEPDPLGRPDMEAWKAKEQARIGGLIAGTMSASVQLAEITRAWWQRLPGVTR